MFLGLGLTCKSLITTWDGSLWTLDRCIFMPIFTISSKCRWPTQCSLWLHVLRNNFIVGSELQFYCCVLPFFPVNLHFSHVVQKIRIIFMHAWLVFEFAKSFYKQVSERHLKVESFIYTVKSLYLAAATINFRGLQLRLLIEGGH